MCVRFAIVLSLVVLTTTTYADVVVNPDPIKAEQQAQQPQQPQYAPYNAPAYAPQYAPYEPSGYGGYGTFGPAAGNPNFNPGYNFSDRPNANRYINRGYR